MVNKQVSLFKDVYSKEVRDFSVNQIVRYIMNGQWKERIEELRKLGKDQYNLEKVKLPGITFSGTFEVRQADKIVTYSNLVCLDLDHLSPELINSLKAKLSEDPYVLFAFVSPSNNGLKIIVPVNTPVDKHKHAFAHLQYYFQEKYEIEIDKSGKDVSRLCFVSSDEFSVYKTAIPFEVDLAYGEVNRAITKTYSNSAPALNTQKIFDICIKWCERTYQYVEGQRNAYLHALACALNRCGVSLDETTNLLNDNFDLDEKEIQHICKSAFYHNQSDHNSVTVHSLGELDTYKAPVYDIKYSDNVIIDDVSKVASMLYTHGLDQKESNIILGKIANFYKYSGQYVFEKKELLTVVNKAINLCKENVVVRNSMDSLNFMLAEDIGMDIIGFDTEGAIATGIQKFDTALRGGFTPGNVYGLIGTDMTFKSILALFFAVVASVRQNKAVLILNGEMSLMQVYERLSWITLNQNLHQLIKEGVVTKETMPEYIKKMTEQTQGNLFFVGGNGWTTETINSTIENIKLKTGKLVEMIIVDGASQMGWGKENEIQATTTNTMKLKELAKSAHDGKGVVILPLFHVSGANNKLFRATGLHIRGGVKTLANLDGYFSTSLLEDTNADASSDDVKYLPGKFYCRLTDKRGAGGIVNAIINVPQNLRLEQEHSDASSYETGRNNIKQSNY